MIYKPLMRQELQISAIIGASQPYQNGRGCVLRWVLAH